MATAATVKSVSATTTDGTDLTAGQTVTITVAMTKAVTVSGIPTLPLNDGGVATYVSGSGSHKLVFTYTVQPTDTYTPALAATALGIVLPAGATITDRTGHNANLGGTQDVAVTTRSGASIVIDNTTATPTVSGVSVVTSNGTNDVNAGSTVTITLSLTDAVKVTGGKPTLSLSDGGIAHYKASLSSPTELVFTYTVKAGQNTTDLTVNGLSFNGATVANAAGTSADLSGATGALPGPVIVDTVAPRITDIAATTSNNSTVVGAGQTVAITLTFTEDVTVTGGPPTLKLNDGGVATCTGGSGNTLIFTYTVGAPGSGQNTVDLKTTAASLALNGATIHDLAGNDAVLSGANRAQVQVSGNNIVIDTTAPAISSVADSTNSPNVAAGAPITLTLTFTEAVTASANASLTLSDGGTATYSGGSGTDKLTFTYTAATAGQNVTITGLAAGTTLTDGAGNPVTTFGETICFMPGTRIATPAGEVSVEALRIGDLVLTAQGEAKPVTWIGRQTVSRVFADPLRVLPIRIAAGALDESLPVRDLLLSPDHALLVDGVLIHAGALVNGTTIRRDDNVPTVFTYYHVELADHALILAEGVPAETFVDNVDRMAFDNWDEHLALYPQGLAVTELPQPRAKSHRQVPMATRARLARRAADLSGKTVAAA